MWREAVPHRGVRQRHPMALGDQHLQELAPALEHGINVLHGRVWKRTGRGAHRVCDVCDEAGIERISLGQLPGGLGNITYLARIDHGTGQLGDREGGHHRALPASRGFEHDQCGLRLAELEEESAMPALSLATCQRLSSGRQARSRWSFETAIPTKPRGRLFISGGLLSVWPSLAYASLELGQLFGLIQEEA
jgi:hypothetical protein